jgi:prolipoprotein diacylglyceryltransferase
MLPYAPQPDWHIGILHVRAFGVLAAAGMLTAYTVAVVRAKRAGLDQDEFGRYLLSILVGAVMALAIGAISGGSVASTAVLTGGIAGAAIWCGVRPYARNHAAELLDITAFAAPFGGALVRLGCTLAHDHRGLPSHSWLAFAFPEGSRYDPGFLEFLFLLAGVTFFLIVARRPRKPLFYFSFGLICYAAFRLCRATIEPNPTYWPWALLFACGAGILACSRVSRVGPAGKRFRGRPPRNHRLGAASWPSNRRRRNPDARIFQRRAHSQQQLLLESRSDQLHPHRHPRRSLAARHRQRG